MIQRTNNEENDMLDLRELWQILIKRKRIIALVTFLTTLGAIGYIMTIKPLYSGSAMLEVGQIVNKQFDAGQYSSLKIEDLDDIKNLQILISTITNVSASIPKDTRLLSISSTGTDKSTIKKNLEKSIAYILNRHEKLSKLYSGQNARIKMTQLIGDITINDTAIKPKKKLMVVVAFITALILSAFLAYFLEFIQVFRKFEIEENK